MHTRDTAESLAPDVLVALVRALFGSREVTVDWGAHVLGCSRDTAHRVLSGVGGRGVTLAEAVTLLDAAGVESIARASAWSAGLVVSKPAAGTDVLPALAGAASSAARAVVALVEAQADGTVTPTERGRVLRDAESARDALDTGIARLRVGA